MIVPVRLFSRTTFRMPSVASCLATTEEMGRKFLSAAQSKETVSASHNIFLFNFNEMR